MAQRGRTKTKKLETLPYFRLRDFPIEPTNGTQKNLAWLQYTEHVQLKLLLSGSVWEDVEEEELEVKVTETDVSVKCKRDTNNDLDSINGKLKKEINPKNCWFYLDRDLYDPHSKNRILTIGLVKKFPGKAWTGSIFQETFFNRKSFGWAVAQQAAENAQQEPTWERLKAGRKSDVEDPFVTSRSWLCVELEEGQTDDALHFRVILDQKKLDEALEKVPYYSLFAADCSEKYFKLFIRGDESSPVLLGVLGGKVMPDRTTLELTKHTREVEGHRIAGTMETLPCLDVTIWKAEEAYGMWEEPLRTDEDMLNRPQGTLDEFEEEQLKAQRCPSPDRDDWTPDDWADEQKEKADAAFKEENYRDAVVYYTRALRFTPEAEKLLSNRSAAYMKLKKFQLALDDILKAEKIEPNWTKLYFRKGQAFRGLKQFSEAIAAFNEGKDLDAGNPEWDREIKRTKDMEMALKEKKGKR